MWDSYKKGFKAYLKLERSLSENSVQAYLDDVNKLAQFAETKGSNTQPKDLTKKDLRLFIEWIVELGLGTHTQARIISGIKAFYKYLALENLI